jgi:hypothetical protein
VFAPSNYRNKFVRWPFSFPNRPTLCQMPIATAQNDAAVLRVKKRNTQYLKVVIFKYFILTIEN